MISNCNLIIVFASVSISFSHTCSLYYSHIQFLSPSLFLSLSQVIRTMPQTDHPLAFGQHSNSDMAASVDDANILIDVLVSLQPRIIKAVDEDAVDPLAAQCAELLDQTPPVFDMRIAREIMNVRSDPDPLKTVLYQELDRYEKKLSDCIFRSFFTLLFALPVFVIFFLLYSYFIFNYYKSFANCFSFCQSSFVHIYELINSFFFFLYTGTTNY